MPTVTWVQETADERFYERGGRDFPDAVPIPVMYECPICGREFGHENQRSWHVSAEHPLARPLLFIDGRAAPSDVVVRTSLSAARISTENCTGARVLRDGVEVSCPIATELGAVLAGTSVGRFDPEFGKTAQLLAAALKERDKRYARPALGFTRRALEHRLSEDAEFKNVDLSQAADGVETFSLFVRVLAPRLREPKLRTEATNMLLAAALWLNYRGHVEATGVAAVLVKELEVKSTATRDRDGSRLISLAERPKEIRAVLDLVAPALSRVAAAEDARESAIRRMTEASDARILAEETAARLNREVVELNDEVASLHSKVAELSETVRATQVHADHDIAGMRARIAGSLTNSLSDLVQTVKEALELDPVGRRQSPKRVRSTSPSY